MGDRTVHACCEQFEIVRYDRAGKWYIEWNDYDRKRIGVKVAAVHASNLLDAGRGEVFFDRPGGQTFDRHVLDMQGINASTESIRERATRQTGANPHES